MNWTSDPPKDQGWYWWRYAGDASVVKVVQGPYGLVIEGHVGLVKCMNANWLGPLSPTDRQQGRVAGAHDYRDAIIKDLDLDNSKQQEFTRTDVILALAHADDTLAQQAQEGGVGDGGKTER